MAKLSGANVKRHVGKGAQEEMLPHRAALTQLTQGDPVQRSMNNYAKMTPIGMDQPHPSMFGVADTAP